MASRCPLADKIDKDQLCQWYLGTKEENPHIRSQVKPKPNIMNNILENIGNTPMVRINSLSKSAGLKCDLVAKCEFFNSGGSVKDRIGLKMVEDAEKSGRIKPGDTLIEPTSGNTGVGLALAAAIKGYRMIITMPEKMSNEKVDMLKALGAEIIRTPTEAAFDAPDSHISVANRLLGEIPNSHILDQYSNPGNPMAHYDTTAEEIWAQCEGKVDMVVLGAGTGGTVTGVARRLKELNPKVIVVAVDPIGSILSIPESLNVPGPSYQVEGTGYDFIPRVLDRGIVDRWVKSRDKESFITARRLIREEGLLCGGSCGAAMYAALDAAKELQEGQRCVVILPDSSRNYMSKFINDGWMREFGFVDDSVIKRQDNAEWWARNTVAQLGLSTPTSISPETTCREAIAVLKEHGFDMVPVQADADGSVLGVLTEGNLVSKMAQGKIKADDPCVLAMYKQFRSVQMDTTLGDLALAFDKDHYALVVTKQTFISKGVSGSRMVVSGVVTRIDLLNYIAKGN